MLKPAETQPDTTLKARVAGWLAGNLIRLLAATLRLRMTDEAGVLGRKVNGGAIWVFWHNRMLVVPWIYTRYIRKFQRATVLTSASRDGAMLAALMRQFGLGAVRGSSSKRGGRALMECCRLLRQHHYVGITPDGPRGPVYQMHPGIVQISRVSRAPILPIRIEYAKAWRLKSWDRLFIPKPFSVVRVHFLPLVQADATDPEAQLAHLTRLLEPEVP
ncbi:MAG: DUF374 domain-containing protein [Verrucomicrobiaceae bacterium]|nr:MAG: DUF374 domain-containing protein [Verrucomicrobiaceae bacterium]